MPGFLDKMLDGLETGPAATAAKKALLWARVSSEMQEERGLSIPEQIQQIRAYAAKNGIEIVAEYYEAVSAFRGRKKRLEFNKMIERAKIDAEITTILVHDMSRFSRDNADGPAAIRELRERGVEVVSLNDPTCDPETVAGVYMQAITFAKNEAYSREVAFHTRKGSMANARTRDPESGYCYKNGGQPLFGYKSKHINMGGTASRPIIKSIWVLNDEVVAGKPIHEWARELLRLAGQRASLDEMTAFLNGNGVPAPRSSHWGQSTVFALLGQDVLLKFAGYGIWNVHAKHGVHRPPSEWVMEPNAHPGILNEAEALAIWRARQDCSKRSRFGTNNRCRSTSYLLSGGILVCGRCGKNMIGQRQRKIRYYVCGSEPYRKGEGCGQAVYIPADGIEREVLKGISGLLKHLVNPKGLARLVNQELERIRKSEARPVDDIEKRLREIDRGLANFRRAVELGEDLENSLKRIRELREERARLETVISVSPDPIAVDERLIQAKIADISKILEYGSYRERKDLIRSLVANITMAPETLEVQVTYRVPEAIMVRLVAGVGFEPTTFGL